MRAPRKQLAGNHAGIALERPLRAATMAGTHQHASLSICPSHSLDDNGKFTGFFGQVAGLPRGDWMLDSQFPDQSAVVRRLYLS